MHGFDPYAYGRAKKLRNAVKYAYHPHKNAYGSSPGYDSEFLDNGEIHNPMLTTSHDERSFKKDRIGDNVGSLMAKKYAEVLQLHIHNHFGTGEYGWSASTYDYDSRCVGFAIRHNFKA